MMTLSIIVMTIYYPHYKDNLISSPTWTFVYVIELSSVSKKKALLKTFLHLLFHQRKPLKICLHLLFHPCQPVSPFFNLTNFEYTLISGWQLSLTLTANLTSTQYLLEIFFNLFYTAPTIEFSSNNIALSNKRL